MGILSISRIPNVDSIIIKQAKNEEFFLGSRNSIVIGENTLLSILQYLVISGIIDKKKVDSCLSIGKD